MKRNIRLAIPSKGALEASTLNLLAECGMKIERRNPRHYLASIPTMPDVEVVFLRAADIPTLVQRGDATLGITGYDLLAEHRGSGDDEEVKDNEELLLLNRDLGYGYCHLVVAVPETWNDVNTCADLCRLSERFQQQQGRGLRIATKYPALTDQFLCHQGMLSHQLLSLHGALETAPLTDAADFIVDLTATGATLHENHLKCLEDGTVLHSQACFIGNAGKIRHDDQALRGAETMLELIDARMQAHHRSILTAYMYSQKSEATQQTCIRLNQCLKPMDSEIEFRVTTSDQAGMPGWSTISSVVNGSAPNELREIVHLLRSAGAAHINATPITYRFTETSIHVRALHERLERRCHE